VSVSGPAVATASGAAAAPDRKARAANAALEADQKWGGLATQSRPKATNQEKFIVAGAIVLLGVLIAAAGQLGSGPRAAADGTAVLAIISLVALGIERIIETFWSFVTRAKHAWWPLNEIGSAVDTQVESMNAAVKPVFDEALAGLEQAQELAGLGSDTAKKLDEQITSLREQKAAFVTEIERINSLARDNQRVNLIATATMQAANRVDTAVGDVMPAVREAFNDATQVATGAIDILAGFKENPAKKLISIYLGMLIGVVIASILRLDLFVAAGAPLTGEPFKVSGFPVLPYLGIAITGLVVGLGSNPTHQVVSLVTDVAKARRSASFGVPEVESGDQPTAETLADPSRSLRTALAAVATTNRAATTTLQIPADRIAAMNGFDHVALGGRRVAAEVDPNMLRATLVREAGGRRTVTIPGEAFVAMDGVDTDALRGQDVEVDLNALRFLDVDDVEEAPSPPRRRPASMNLTRK
jgi:hypothetical protein